MPGILARLPQHLYRAWLSLFPESLVHVVGQLPQHHPLHIGFKCLPRGRQPFRRGRCRGSCPWVLPAFPSTNIPSTADVDGGGVGILSCGDLEKARLKILDDIPVDRVALKFRSFSYLPSNSANFRSFSFAAFYSLLTLAKSASIRVSLKATECWALLERMRAPALTAKAAIRSRRLDIPAKFLAT